MHNLKPNSFFYYFAIGLVALVFYALFLHGRLYGEFDFHLNYGTVIHDNFADYRTLHFWTHLVSGGLPQYADPQIPLLEFANLLYTLIPKAAAAITASILAYMLLAGIGMFLLVNELERNKKAALLASVAYMFSGNMLYSIGAVPFFYASAVIPLLFFFLVKATRADDIRRSVLFSLFAAAAWSLQILSGGAMVFLWTALAVALFIAYFFIINCLKNFGKRQLPIKESVKKFVAIGFVLFLFTLLFSAGKLLPSIDVKEMSQRNARIPTYEEFAWEHTQVKAEKVFGSFLFERGSRIYHGPIVFVLMLASLLRLRKPRVIFFWLLAIASLLVEVGTPLTKAAYAVPVLNQTRQVYNVLALFSFASAALAASGSVALFRLVFSNFSVSKLKLSSTRAQSAAIIFVALLVCANAFLAFNKSYAPVTVESVKEELDQNYLLRNITFDKDVFRIHHPAQNFVGNSISRYTVALGLQTSEWTSGSLWFPKYVVFNQIAGTFLNQSAKWWGIQNVKYAPSPVLIDESRVPGFKLVQTFPPCKVCTEKVSLLYKNERYLPRAYFVNTSFLVVDSDIMWVTYDIMLQDYFDPSQVIVEIDNRKLRDATLDKLLKYDAIIVVDRNLSSEAEFLLKQYEGQNKVVARNILTQEWVDFKARRAGDVKKFLEKKGPFVKNLDFLFSNIPKNEVEALPVTLTPTKVTIKIENALHPRFLVLSDRFSEFGEWKAAFNGKKLGIRNANVVASVIDVPEGEAGTLELNYRPTKFFIGLALTLAALAFSALFAVYVKESKGIKAAQNSE